MDEKNQDYNIPWTINYDDNVNIIILYYYFGSSYDCIIIIIYSVKCKYINFNT